MDDHLLLKKGIHRLGNVLVPQDSYGPVIERKMQQCLRELYNEGKKNISTYELLEHLGGLLDESSFLYWASKNHIPVMYPELWMVLQEVNFGFLINDIKTLV